MTRLYLFLLLTIVSAQRLDPYSCKRKPSHTTADKLPGDNGFSIKILSTPEPQHYVPGQEYNIVVNGSYTSQQFLDFMLIAVRKDDMNNERRSVGHFSHLLDHMTRSDRSCPHVQTSVTYHPSYKKSSARFMWTAPSKGTGCILFRATIIEHPDIWYSDDGGLTKMLCEQTGVEDLAEPETATPDSPLPGDEPRDERSSHTCCACGVAKYELTFVGNWSRETHPKNFPSRQYESLLHWSDVIGASHSPDYHLWRYDTIASRGVKEVCEYGWPKSLEGEIKQQSKSVRTIIKTAGIWGYPALYTQKRTARFSTDNTRSHVSLITMVGPSPDWCVGLDSVNLCLPNCTWHDKLELDLYPWDAGTDNGLAYLSPNAPTYPREPIRKLTNTYPNNPQSPFYGDDEVLPMARVSLRRINKNTNTENRRCDVATPDSEDGTAESDNTSDNHNEFTDPKCMTTEWSDFTACSVTCGVGTKVRVRRFKNRMGSIKTCPNVKIRETDNCLGLINECAGGDNEYVDICVTTPWSTWSPCTVTCGTGQKTRTRQYFNQMGALKCDSTLTDTMSCNADIIDCRKADMMTDWAAVCSSPAEAGRCQGTFPRYFYNSDMSKCLQFEYGGCRGNKNNFLTLGECERACSNIMTNNTVSHSDHDLTTDIDCMVTGWTEYSECSVTCGAGTKYRTRMIKLQSSGNGERCPKDLYDTAVCASSCDVESSDNVDCMLSDWFPWESCSTTCGIGIQVRQRMIKRQAQGQGRPCTEDLKEMTECNLGECDSGFPQCMLTEFFDWSDCDCITGKMMRQRMMKRGPCPPNTELVQAKPCDIQGCIQGAAIDCVLSAYSEWTDCSSSCGLGKQTRFRMVITPAENGGSCVVRSGERKIMEMRSCYLENCPENDGRAIDCEVSQWGDWSDCSKTCGRGRQVRRRKITTRPHNGGRDCPQVKDVRQCDTGVRCRKYFKTYTGQVVEVVSYKQFLNMLDELGEHEYNVQSLPDLYRRR